MDMDTETTETHVPNRNGDDLRPPPRIRNKLWMAGVVALAVGVALLVRRRRH